MNAPADWEAARRRALGAYLGFAIGDALGATVEFLTPAEIRRDFGVHREIVGGGWLKLKAGQVTDDTGMALALGRAIVAHPQWDLRAVADAFLAWLRTRPVDVGNTCRRGIVRYLHDGTLVSPPHEGDAGNGAAMRNLPVALATLGDDARFERWTLEQCRFTHHHPLSDAAALTLGRMAQRLVCGHGVGAARALADGLVAAHRTFRFEPWRGRSSAYVVDTVQTVFHAFFATAGFEDCVLAAVNAGGDADTAGALAAMLAGAAHGPEAIPARWRRRLDAAVAREAEAQADALVEIARGRCGR